MMDFDTSVLDRALAEQQARREQERAVLLAHLLRLLDKIATQFNLEQVYIFGSLVQSGHFREGSDVDVAVKTLPPDQFFTFSAALSAALGRDVDLIELDKCHFATRSGMRVCCGKRQIKCTASRDPQSVG